MTGIEIKADLTVMYAYHHLMSLGLSRDLLATAVALIAGHAVLWRPFRKHQKTQRRIADSLDTSTPGGLTDLVNAVRSGTPRVKTD